MAAIQFLHDDVDKIQVGVDCAISFSLISWKDAKVG